jgi:hypothetical protein
MERQYSLRVGTRMLEVLLDQMDSGVLTDIGVWLWGYMMLHTGILIISSVIRMHHLQPLSSPQGLTLNVRLPHHYSVE